MVRGGLVFSQEGLQVASVFVGRIFGPFDFDGIEFLRCFNDKIDFCAARGSKIGERTFSFVGESFVKFKPHPLLKERAGIGGERVACE